MRLATPITYAHPAVFPSPGGDVLRRKKPLPEDAGRAVSVPWRGCVASIETMTPAELERFSSPSGVVLRHLAYIQRFGVRCFRPLVGMCCIRTMIAIA